MNGKTGFLRAAEEETLLALERINRRIAAMQAAEVTVPEALMTERRRLAARIAESAA